MLNLVRAALLALPVLLAAGTAGAQDQHAVIEQPWARATPGGSKTGAVYLTARNPGGTPDRILAVASPVAERAELHTMTTVDGVMRMRPVDAIAVNPGEAVTLKPGGLHVMLTGLKAPLKEGATFPLTVTFEKAGKVEITVPVEKIAAMAPGNTAGNAAGNAAGMGGHAGHAMPSQPAK